MADTDDHEIYVAENAPTFSIVLVIDKERKRIQFRNKVLKLHKKDDKAIITELDRMLNLKPALTQQVRKLDVDAAEQIAKAHQQEMFAMTGAAKGTMNTRQANLAAKAKLAQQAEDLRRQGATPEALEKMMQEIGEDNVTVTEEGTPPFAGTREGFVPAAGVEQKDATPSETKSVFAALGKK